MSSPHFILVFSPSEGVLDYEYHTFSSLCGTPARKHNEFTNHQKRVGLCNDLPVSYFNNTYADLIAWANDAEVSDTINHRDGMWVCLGNM